MHVTQRRRAQRRALDPHGVAESFHAEGVQVVPAPESPSGGTALAAAGTARQLSEALAAGMVSTDRDRGHPRYVWFRSGPEVIEFRLIAATSPPSYVGYALEPSYWPEGMK
jgi:hypothetical protein